jgi:transposase
VQLCLALKAQNAQEQAEAAKNALTRQQVDLLALLQQLSEEKKAADTRADEVLGEQLQVSVKPDKLMSVSEGQQ